MLKIRPHHLLCMMAYQGKGYSEEFNINMENVINKLKEDSKKVEIVYNLDDICIKCPNNISGEACTTQDKVNTLDKNVCKYFDISQGTYSYKKLKEKISENATEDIIDNICKNCEWYEVTYCKKTILDVISQVNL